MTIAKRKKNAPLKKSQKKVKKHSLNKLNFIKRTFNLREIEMEDESITNPLLINNILE